MSSKNTTPLYCPREPCRSLVIKAGVASRDEQLDTQDVPAIPGAGPAEAAAPQEWFRVEDKFAFENIGLSREVAPRSTIRYLMCADCELAPLGFHDTRSPDVFYIDAARLRTQL